MTLNSRPFLAALVALLALPAAARADFYTPPDPLPPGQPGDVIRAQPTTANVVPGVQMSANAWLVLYRSETATGQPTAVSGLVLVPDTPWRGPGPRPLVGYAIGSQGLADRCAGSKKLAAGLEYEAPQIADALSHGWALALTDYPGLGTPGTHPYVVGRTLGPAVLDSMRAALRLKAAELDPRAPLAIYGYSEGGAAAGWALQLQPTYAPDLPLKGAGVGAAPANFSGEIDFLQHGGGQLVAWLQLYAAIGFDAVYPELKLDRYLNANGRSEVSRLQNSCLEDAIVLGLPAPKDISFYTTSYPLDQPAWHTRLEQNNLGGIAPRPPVVLGSARQDEAIDPMLTLNLYHQWCALGVNARFVDIRLGDHILGVGLFASAAFPFLADRLAGKPVAPASDCIAARQPAGCERAPTITLSRVRVSARGVRVRGRAAPAACPNATPIKHIGISVALRAGRRCRHVGPRGRLGRPRPCDKVTFARARGTRQFTYSIRALVGHPLPRGRYIVKARAVDRAGHKSPTRTRRVTRR